MPTEAIAVMGAQTTQKVAAEEELVENVKHQLGDANYDELVTDARAATEAEQTMTLREGLRRYPKAIGWSVLLSSAIIMTGFDVVLLGSFYGFPQFNRRFGVLLPNGSYTVTAAWQAGLSNGGKCGEIMGLCINGWAMERFGCRKTMIGALTAIVATIFLPVFAINIQMLLAGQILMGMSWGVFETLTTTYAAEVMPVALRPYLTAYVNLCWVIGQIIASGALRGVLSIESEWSYRIPFALQWIWPVPILIGCFFAPESPWWQIRNGRTDDARRTVRRLWSNPTETEVDAQVAMMKHTDALEKSISSGTSYWDCFTGVDRRRTEVASGVWAIQNLCGSAFMGYSTFFLQQAGLPVSQSFNLSIGQYALGMAGTLSSWVLMRHFGRRTLYLAGLVGMFALLTVIGGMGFISRGNTGSQWAVGALLLIYTAIYDATVGPCCYTLVAEISSTRLRAKTTVIARIVYNLVAIVNAIIMPYFLNTGALNWGAKTGLFWAGMCCICIVWAYFRLPEPRGRTY
ncbi:hypothetical protein JCM5296_004355, partial [Sporobolomyces johnsonii]